MQNLHDIHESLTLAASLPDQTERAGANLQLQISNLRANASRLPKALSKMVLTAADDFEGDAAEASIAQLNQMLSETRQPALRGGAHRPLSVRQRKRH